MATRKATAKTASKVKPPWDRENPNAGHHEHLTPAQKAAAKRRAKKAGRPYPNLVDNMRASREGKK